MVSDRAQLEAAIRVSDPRLRLARPEDGPRIEALLSGLAALEWPDLPVNCGSNIERMLRQEPRSFILVVEDANRIAGCVALHVLPDVLAGTYTLVIDDLFVDIVRRGRGIGGALVAGALALALAAGCKRVFMHLDPKNTKAARLVEKHGLRPDPDRIWSWAV